MQTEADILVIGGGIAGFSAALCAARLGYTTHVLTGATLGGHLISIESIEGYPGFEEGVPGYDLCPIVQAQATDAGAGVAMAEATTIAAHDGGWRVTSPAGDYLARSIIAATGTRLRALGVQGETELFGKGVSHCASCDAPLLGGKPVVVVGGGDSAAQEALFLVPHAATVTIVHHGAALTCQRSFAERLETADNIEYVPNASVAAVLGDEAVTGVAILDAQGAKSEREAAGVFVYIGLAPCTQWLEGIVELNDSGHVITDARLTTSAAGIFAAGTLRAGSHGRAAAAAGEGTAAALAAGEFLGGTA
ncbi:MAG TPA: FAD-dependent oxidoreductase [Gammaproteobacteria bacterium]|nr:FAD-dependent oxidoreductase [Gammaproteobacteria bacterium]